MGGVCVCGGARGPLEYKCNPNGKRSDLACMRRMCTKSGICGQHISNHTYCKVSNHSLSVDKQNIAVVGIAEVEKTLNGDKKGPTVYLGP